MAHIDQEARLGGLGAPEAFLALFNSGEIGKEDDRASSDVTLPVMRSQLQLGMAAGIYRTVKALVGNWLYIGFRVSSKCRA